MTKLTITATDEGTYIVKASFSDDIGAFIPTSIKWSLSDLSGSVINSRYEVVISPAANIVIVLAGDDINNNDGKDRVFTLEALYDSAEYGNNRVVKTQAFFTIDNWLDIQP